MVPLRLHAVNYKTERKMVLSQVRTFIQKREEVMKNINQQYHNIHLNNQIIQFERYTKNVYVIQISFICKLQVNNISHFRKCFSMNTIDLYRVK